VFILYNNDVIQTSLTQRRQSCATPHKYSKHCPRCNSINGKYWRKTQL